MRKRWIWMALFTVIFLGIGIYDWAQGEILAAAGYLIGGAGAGLVTWGERRSPEQGTHDPLALVGSLVMAVGIVLIVIHLFG